MDGFCPNAGFMPCGYTRHMSTNLPIFRMALVAAGFLTLAACGNKGPLVMPQKPVPVQTQPTTETQPAQTEPADDASQPADSTTLPAKDSGGQ